MGIVRINNDALCKTFLHSLLAILGEGNIVKKLAPNTQLMYLFVVPSIDMNRTPKYIPVSVLNLLENPDFTFSIILASLFFFLSATNGANYVHLQASLYSSLVVLRDCSYNHLWSFKTIPNPLP